MKPIRMKQQQGTAYFGLVQNVATGKTSWRAPIGVKTIEGANEVMPYCPEDAKPGHVVLRRMTKAAPCQLTKPVQGWGERLTRNGWEPHFGAVYSLHHDLPVSDHYYRV